MGCHSDCAGARRIYQGTTWQLYVGTAANANRSQRSCRRSRRPCASGLQAVFEHGQRSAEKGDYDYAHDLFSQCMVDDPANLIYLQHFLGNLAQKYGNNKKGSRFAGLRTKTTRMTLNKATGKGQWREAFTAACEALKANPWETSTLLDVADAYQQIGSDECQLFVLRWALDASPKDVTVNRKAAEILTRLGQFDQAISCWRRVEQAKPSDEEAAKAISQSERREDDSKRRLQPGLAASHGDRSEGVGRIRSRSRFARPRRSDPRGSCATAKRQRRSRSREGTARRDRKPAGRAGELPGTGRRVHGAESLARGLGNSDARAGRFGRRRLAHSREDWKTRICGARSIRSRSPSAGPNRTKRKKSIDLAKRMAAQANQAELEVYAARVGRNPGNSMLQYELGLRCKKAGKFKEAIQAFQAARDEIAAQGPGAAASGRIVPAHPPIQARPFELRGGRRRPSDDMQPDTKKLALYRAGVLAAELNDRERAEKYLTQLAAIDFGYRDVAERLDKLAALRDSV